MRRRRRDGNHLVQENNSIQDSIGNEENGYPGPDPNKTMINVTKEPSDTHERTLKEEIFGKKSLRNVVNHNVQDALKKFQDTKNKEQKTKKQINELREDFNKH
jgi:hypothetical protein